MNSKKTEKKKIKITVKSVALVSLLLVGLSIGAIIVFALDTWSTGYKVYDNSTNRAIHLKHETSDVCGYVDNDSGYDIFIGTKSIYEWHSFKDNEPANTNACVGGLSSYPGQRAWFTSVNNCGSWDYNCDGEVTKEHPISVGVATDLCLPRCTVGFWNHEDYPNPGCGEEGTWIKDHCLYLPPIFWWCGSEYRTQGCH